MTILLEMTISVFLLVSFIPVIILHRYRSYKRYRLLRYLINTTFVYSILTFITYFSNSLMVVYYASALIYPMVFLFVYLSFETIRHFLGYNPMPRVRIVAVGFFFLNLSMALTNPLHRWYLSIIPSEVSSVEDVFFTSYGPFFYLHTAIGYGLVLISMGFLLWHFKRPRKTHYGYVPFFSILALIIIGFGLNVWHVFITRVYFSPTYITFVLFAFFLYWLVFNRDFRFRLLSGSRDVLINAMREMYIIADKDGHVIEYSNALIDKFDVPREAREKLDAFLDTLRTHAVLYKTFDHIKDDPYIDKAYLYTIIKNFSIPGFEQTGILVLMYDETRLMQLVDRLNYYIRYDDMSGIYNRNFFEKNRKAYEKKYPNAGMIISDLNGLKLHNDYFGHAAGDRLIRRYVDILKRFESEHVLPFRMGGDEFLLLCLATDTKTVKKIQREILAACESKDFEEHISVSIGNAVRQDNESLEETLRRADDELYEMKSLVSPTYRNSFKAWIKRRD